MTLRDLKWAEKRNADPGTYSSDPPLAGPGPPATTTVLKRRAPNDENQPPPVTPRNKHQKRNKAATTPFTPVTPQQPTQHRFEDHEKFDRVCDTLAGVNWTFCRNARFLRGESKVTPTDILQLWDNHLYGQEERDSLLLYSTNIHFSQIKPVRLALTSYAAQKCLRKVHREGAAAVKPSAGLHASARKNTNNTSKLEWQRIGLSTIARDGPAIPQPPKPPKATSVATKEGAVVQVQGEQVGDQAKECTEGAQAKAGDVSVVALVKGGSAVTTTAQSSTRRPTYVVVMHALWSLLYKHNSEARLLPLAVRLLAFAYSTPADFMAYCSHIAMMPAYTTISKSLKLFAADQFVHIQAHGAGVSTAGLIQANNVQNYKRARDLHIGSINKMNISLAATYCELPNMNVSSLSLEDRQLKVKKNERASLTFDILYGFLNMEHLNTIISLHWLRILVDYIPELNHLQPQVSELLKARSSKISVCIPEGATPVHPLSSSSKCENITTELKDAMFDFLSQVGHKENDYRKQLIMVGSDGLTFQHLLELQRYLQFHDDPCKNLSIVEPVLLPWHTEWTDGSCIFECHCDAATSPDPSTIGHSATVIGRRIPANVGKIDYFPDIDMMIHFDDCLDIFQHFTELATSGKLPTLDELDLKAQHLHKTYSTTRAAQMALGDVSKDSKWAKSVPLGKKWMKRADESFLLFSFAGSSHQKYCSYLLEVVTRFKLESSPELIETILKMTLVNLSGFEGSAMASDIMQEYFNRLLEAIVKKKGINYGDPFACNIISPNLSHFARIKFSL
ncbi:hypothetical protein FA13DRAFT_1796456 [Coprinellus micaceus]|uniref:DUF6589 domain-containing protein n=1 Tax=Coprinellus micaceus TaxID=71717 RepID=A0A4Y7SUR1_COPMI|nr:hypothetical protein FA13DRAFT_1796456 [Coprinellus micaceus]